MEPGRHFRVLFLSAYLIAVPFAGILIDRSNRKTMMLVYDFLSLVALTVLLMFQTMGLLEVWHLYCRRFPGNRSAFQSPSYAAAITSMVSKQQYIRANGLISLLYEIPGIFGPLLLAGVLYLAIGLNGIW